MNVVRNQAWLKTGTLSVHASAQYKYINCLISKLYL